MADIHRWPNIEEVEREASEWIARLDADDVSGEDRARFGAWLQSHPLHARTYRVLLVTWRQFWEAAPLSKRPGRWYLPKDWGRVARATSGIVVIPELK